MTCHIDDCSNPKDGVDGKCMFHSGDEIAAASEIVHQALFGVPQCKGNEGRGGCWNNVINGGKFCGEHRLIWVVELKINGNLGESWLAQRVTPKASNPENQTGAVSVYDSPTEAKEAIAHLRVKDAINDLTGQEYRIRECPYDVARPKLVFPQMSVGFFGR